MDYKSYFEDEGDDDDYAWRFGSLALDRRAFCEGGRILFREGGSILGAESMLNLSREFVVPIFRYAIRHAREVCERKEHPPSRTERTGIFANSLRQSWKEALVDKRPLIKQDSDLLSNYFFKGETWWDIGVLSPSWGGFGGGFSYGISPVKITQEEVEDWLTKALASDGEGDVRATLQELQGMLEVAGRNIESSKRINDQTEDVLKDMGEALAPVSQL